MTPLPALLTQLEATLNQWGRLPVSASNSPAMSGSINLATGARLHTWDALRPRNGDATEMPLGGMGQGAVGPGESAWQTGEYAS